MQRKNKYADVLGFIMYSLDTNSAGLLYYTCSMCTLTYKCTFIIKWCNIAAADAHKLEWAIKEFRGFKTTLFLDKGAFHVFLFSVSFLVHFHLNLVHCCIKWPQNLQVKTLLQTYTGITCIIYNKILCWSNCLLNKILLILKKFFTLKSISYNLNNLYCRG